MPTKYNTNDRMEENELVVGFSTYGGEERLTHGCGGGKREVKSLRRTKRRWQDNVENGVEIGRAKFCSFVPNMCGSSLWNLVLSPFWRL